MKNFRFESGQEVKSLSYVDSSNVIVGQNDVEKITVVTESKSVAGIVWFAIWKNGKVVSKRNAAFVASVVL